jgi:hypothetical protein
MPHAKKELNPLWALLAEPLFQIIAAVGLLLSGVLGLVGKIVGPLLGPIVCPLLLSRLPLWRLFSCAHTCPTFVLTAHSLVVLVWVVFLTVSWEVLALTRCSRVLVLETLSVL